MLSVAHTILHYCIIWTLFYPKCELSEAMLAYNDFEGRQSSKGNISIYVWSPHYIGNRVSNMLIS